MAVPDTVKTKQMTGRRDISAYPSLTLSVHTREVEGESPEEFIRVVALPSSNAGQPELKC